jgi:hypothetical protein
MIQFSNFIKEAIEVPRSVLVLGRDGWLFSQELEREFRSLDVLFLKQDRFLHQTIEDRFDLIISVNTAAFSDYKANFQMIEKMANISSLVIFSSNVPCFENKSPAFWPSYWISILEKLECTYSLTLRKLMWSNTLVPPNILEGLIVFKS